MNSMVSELSLYDVANVPGVACDISHINTKAQVKVRKAWLQYRASVIADPFMTAGCAFVAGL